MSYNLLVMPKVFPLERLVLHEIAKKLWNVLVYQYSERRLTLSLICDKIYRDRILQVLSGILPNGFSRLLKDKLVDASIIVKLGWKEAFSFQLLNSSLITLGERNNDNWKIILRKWQRLLSPAKNSNVDKYEASRFINPLGHFDDLSWAKIFVDDKHQLLKSRFFIACIYCFEEQIYSLWTSIKANNETFDEEHFIRISEIHALVKTWILLLVKRNFEVNFYVDGFHAAFSEHRYHAANFFFKHCSVDERKEILSKLDFDELHTAAMCYRSEFVDFVYSLLSSEFIEKNSNSFYVSERKETWMYGCELSCYYKTILNDILTSPRSVPFKFYGYILDQLASFIRYSLAPLHKEIFIMLWNHLSQYERNWVLSSTNILNVLIMAEDIDLFEMIILPLPRAIKEAMLFNDYDYNLQSMPLIEVDDPEVLMRYLFFFFLNYEVTSQKVRFIPDASSLLTRFMNSVIYGELTRKCGQLKYYVTMEHFKGTFAALGVIINQIDYAECTHHFFSEKIFPLLSVKDKNFYRK